MDVIWIKSKKEIQRSTDIFATSPPRRSQALPAPPCEAPIVGVHGFPKKKTVSLFLKQFWLVNSELQMARPQKPSSPGETKEALAAWRNFPQI